MSSFLVVTFAFSASSAVDLSARCALGGEIDTTMMRFLIALAYPALLLPLYLAWSRDQAETQIDKMQEAVFNSPGTQAPLPPVVMLGGVGLLLGYGLLTWLLRLPGWLRLIALALGAPAGVAVFMRRQQGA
jgi:hypothetical protein